jgi:hypothetical protein
MLPKLWIYHPEYKLVLTGLAVPTVNYLAAVLAGSKWKSEVDSEYLGPFLYTSYTSYQNPMWDRGITFAPPLGPSVLAGPQTNPGQPGGTGL